MSPSALPPGRAAVSFRDVQAFHPAIAAWFERRFPQGPTEAQAHGWPSIAAGHDTLIAAPTGSGKTLAAFLVAIDSLFRAHDAGTLSGETSVVYVSPLKALAVDIHHNLEQPLAEIASVAAELGLSVPELSVAVRTGDTPASARGAMLRRPPHLFVTTPESLYLLLTSQKSRSLLGSVRTVIVDEIHALARDKRGSHLALTLERLEHVCRTRPVRVGLSATQRPIERVAELLSGAASDRCRIVDFGHRRALDVAIELPDSELEAVASSEQSDNVLSHIARHVQAHRTTLIFVNTRRMAERTAHQLAKKLGEDRVAAHHGSLSKERRARVEARLRSGDLSALVATASLELGIDIGPVELVCQIGSPRSIATFLQRVGRSGHSVGGTPMGRLYPLTRDELCECVALLAAVRAGRLDALLPPVAPLDILAQQIVAECAAEEWHEDALYERICRAAPYAALSRDDYETVLELVSQGVTTGRGKRAAYVHRDRPQGLLRGRRGARLAALTSGGAIPEVADYRVVADPDDTFVGTVNEDWAIESMVGDVFVLGTNTWRIRRVEPGKVRVVDAAGALPSVPFWLGEAPARTAELSHELSELRRLVDERLALGENVGARELVEERAGVCRDVAELVVQYLAAGRAALGVLPTQRDVVFERFFDDTGGMQLVIHAPFGGRINRGLGLALRKRFCRSFDFELQAAASDDAIVLSLGPQHSFPLEDVPGFLHSRSVREVLVQASLASPMFAARWRWNLNRALVVLRVRGGKKNPPPIQRMESDDVMAAVFPALAACQENVTGPVEIPDHPLVQQTVRDCLEEAMDIDGLTALLRAFESGEVRLHFRDTPEPSLLSHEILNARPYTFLDDAPLEERRTRAVRLTRGLPVDPEQLAEFHPEAIARVRDEAAPNPANADELFDLLTALVVSRPRDDWQPLFAELLQAERVASVDTKAGELWCTRECQPLVKALFPAVRLPWPNAGEPVEPEGAAALALRGHLDLCGPTSADALAAATGLSLATVAAGLARLELEGFAFRGRFDPMLSTTPDQFCARRLLARIHAYSQNERRRSVTPATSQDFVRFLLSWQHVVPGRRRQGRRGLLTVIEALQGFELAAGAWEDSVLAERVEGYRSEWLDSLCLSGSVVWGRLGADGGARQTASAPSRATPVTLALRDDLPWLLEAARGTSRAEPSEGSRVVVDALTRRGALFASELAQETGLRTGEIEQALWDGVARGLVTADAFTAMRSLLSARIVPSSAPRRRLRRGARGISRVQGRWALLSAPPSGADRDELCEAVAEQLLARWGVVFWDVIARESLALPWREIVWALRRLEARGVALGGRFISGFVGEQFALPEAFDLLSRIRKQPRDGTTVIVSATDPLNVAGILTPGAKVSALRTHAVVFRDGAVVAGGPRAELSWDAASVLTA